MTNSARDIDYIRQSCFATARLISKQALGHFVTKEFERPTRIGSPTNPVVVIYYQYNGFMSDEECHDIQVNGHLIDVNALDLGTLSTLDDRLTDLLRDVTGDYNTVIQKALK